jgi:UDP-glucose 4-epimerase
VSGRHTGGADLRRACIVGGAGFVGSHLVDRLLADEATEQVTVFDNLSSGRLWHLAHHEGDGRLRVTRGDVSDLDALTEAVRGCGAIVHLASNPDIARAVTEPAVDFDQGTLLTHHVVEAARRAGVGRIVYASGSGVYGDLGDLEVDEDHGPLEPISTYGASKLAGEALIASYAHMFDLTGVAFRFANVVGPRQTHGVGYDFTRRLLADPTRLSVLGDGSQSKSYIYVTDVVEAVLLAAAEATRPFSVYNVGTHDHVTVRRIAEMAVELAGTPATTLELGTGDRGWKGDVPVVRLRTERIRKLGWSNQHTSEEAMRMSLRAVLDDARSGRQDAP